MLLHVFANQKKSEEFCFYKKGKKKNLVMFVMYTLSSESGTAKLLPWELPYTKHLSVKPP